MFQNLVQNAIKYGRRGGKVESGWRASRRLGRPALPRRRDRRRPRHRPAASAAADRALLSRERRGQPREGRHRASASPSSSTSSTAIAASWGSPPSWARARRSRSAAGAGYRVRNCHRSNMLSSAVCVPSTKTCRQSGACSAPFHDALTQAWRSRPSAAPTRRRHERAHRQVLRPGAGAARQEDRADGRPGGAAAGPGLRRAGEARPQAGRGRRRPATAAST